MYVRYATFLLTLNSFRALEKKDCYVQKYDLQISIFNMQPVPYLYKVELSIVDESFVCITFINYKKFELT